jgi:hypothetical protein
MVKAWILTITASLLKWGIPESVVQNLSSLAAAAESALEAAKNESTRAPVATARCKESFDALTAEMRDIKKRYLLSPPLTDSDFVALGLKPHDSTHTPSGVSTAQVGQKAYGFLSRSLRLAANSTQLIPYNYVDGVLRSKTPKLSGVSRIARHELGIKLVYVSGSPNDPANKGYRIWYSVVGQGEAPSERPEDLRKSFFTMRKNDLLQFDYGESGQTAYVAVQIENSGGKQGPWGPMVFALIP